MILDRFKLRKRVILLRVIFEKESSGKHNGHSPIIISLSSGCAQYCLEYGE